MLRLYPVVRFVIVSGSKGKMLDVPALGALTTFLGGWGTCERALHADKEHAAPTGSPCATARRRTPCCAELDRVIHGRACRGASPSSTARSSSRGGDDPGAMLDAVVIATAPDDAARLSATPRRRGSAPCRPRRSPSRSTRTSAVPPPEAREGAGRDANMIYVAGDARRRRLLEVCMSVRWDGCVAAPDPDVPP